MENIYARLFLHTGRPAIPARHVIGALILKYIPGVSDDELTQQLRENPYLQFFIGLEHYQDTPPFQNSTLSRVREQLSEKESGEFERSLLKLKSF